MQIEVRLYSTMAKYVPLNTRDTLFKLEIQPGTKVEDILSLLKIPESDQKIMLINGKIVESKKRLQPEDVCNILLPLFQQYLRVQN